MRAPKLTRDLFRDSGYNGCMFDAEWVTNGHFLARRSIFSNPELLDAPDAQEKLGLRELGPMVNHRGELIDYLRVWPRDSRRLRIENTGWMHEGYLGPNRVYRIIGTDFGVMIQDRYSRLFEGRREARAFPSGVIATSVDPATGDVVVMPMRFSSDFPALRDISSTRREEVIAAFDKALAK